MITIGSHGMEREIIGAALLPVTVESNPEFAKQYEVKASDPEVMKRAMTSSFWKRCWPATTTAFTW